MRYEPISQDPDLIQAIEDFGDQVLKVRDMSARAIVLPIGSDQRTRLEKDIRSRIAGFELRGRRIGVSGSALFELVNAAIDAKARRGRPAPSRDTSRTLITNISNAHAREATAEATLKAAQEEVAAAAAHRRACEEAAEAWGIRRTDR